MEINDLDETGYALIHYLAMNGNTFSILHYQETADLNLTVKNSNNKYPLNGYTPVMLAINNGHKDTAEILARLGANLNQGVDGLTPLMIAIQHRTKAIELTKMLVGLGADATLYTGAVEKHGISILDKLNVKQNFQEAIGNIFKDIESTKLTYAESTPITAISIIENAVSNKAIKINEAFDECNIPDIIKYIDDPNMPNCDKYICNLFAAAAMQKTPQHTELMVALIKAGYDIAAKDSEEITAYQHVKEAENGIALILLGANADIAGEINTLDKSGYNEIHKAIIEAKYELLTVLLSSGGDANIADKYGNLPLSLVMASNEHMEEMFHILVKNGANLDEYDMDGLQYAIDNEIIDPKSLSLVDNAKQGQIIENETAEAVIKLYNNNFWQKIINLELNQVGELINQFNILELNQINELINYFGSLELSEISELINHISTLELNQVDELINQIIYEKNTDSDTNIAIESSHQDQIDLSGENDNSFNDYEP